ncbi:MAG: imidazole glycerol phosphate synthase subunit HisH [Chitinophagaceae bacterium]|nr:imidazole glycerol phosphate synthase subunit HisH [Chitinophagaceae bacterium]
MIAIINYNVGNLLSIQNMFKKTGAECCITSDEAVITNASKILLPGVGHFDYCMQQFNSSGLRPVIERKVLDQKTPVLGICVGHQMLFENSEEGVEPGLGWLPGQVVKFDAAKMPASYKIPHMGWTDVVIQNKATLFSNIEEPRFYMVHSYYVQCADELVAATAEYGYLFVTAVEKDNIFGTQFHPEKSHKFGMQLLKNFSNL